MEKFLPMKFSDLNSFLLDYKNFKVLDLDYIGDSVFFLRFKKINANGKDEIKIVCNEMVENLIQRHNFLTNNFRDDKKMLSFYPVFEIYYHPIGYKHKIVVYINYLNKLDNNICEDYWNSIEKEYSKQVSKEVYNKNRLFGVSIDISNWHNSEEAFMKVFNYHYFLKTGKTCYEELLEDVTEEYDDILAIRRENLRDVRILQRLHRQTLFSFFQTKDIDSVRIF